MRLLLLLMVTVSTAVAQERRHLPGPRAEMVVTGRVTRVLKDSFTLTGTKIGSYTIRISKATVFRAPKSQGKKALVKNVWVTAQGFVARRTIDARSITFLGRSISKLP